MIHDLVLFLLMGRRSTATFPFLHRSILPRFNLYPAALTAEEFAQLRRVLDVVHGAGEILRGYIIGAVNALLAGKMKQRRRATRRGDERRFIRDGEDEAGRGGREERHARDSCKARISQ